MNKKKSSWSLLSCPFCGGRPELRIAPHPMNDSFNQILISCTKCGARSCTKLDGKDIKGRVTETSEAVENVVSSWNKRADIKDLFEKIYEVEDKISTSSRIINEMILNK